LLGVNANLPKNIRIHWIDEKKPEFHARYSALTRTYRYYISNQSYRSALQHNHLTWEKNNLDEKLMNIASKYLLGEHDFTSFRAAGCQSLSPNRNVQFVKAWREDNLVIFEITANSFLHHMVRNIVGSLIIIGKGERPPEWISSLIFKRDRTIAAPTAPSNGLYLCGIKYPEEFSIPKYKFGPKFL
jgi:tRNA pseudouridine38-40 synthase